MEKFIHIKTADGGQLWVREDLYLKTKSARRAERMKKVKIARFVRSKIFLAATIVAGAAILDPITRMIGKVLWAMEGVDAFWLDY